MITNIEKVTGGWLFYTDDTGSGNLLAYNIDDVQLSLGTPGQPYYYKDSQISEIDQVYRTTPEPPYLYFVKSNNTSNNFRESDLLKNKVIINFMQIQDAEETEKIEYWFYNNDDIINKINHEYNKYYQILDLSKILNNFENIITQQTVVDGIKGDLINLGIIYRVKNPPQNAFKILKKNDTNKTITIRVK